MAKSSATITVSWERDITAVTWYYKLQASTASPPAKPTTATPSGWTTTEPTYTEGSTNSLYTVQKTTFSDGTFEYSDVSLSSSYEASKAAYNKSVAALEAATPIETKTYSGLIGSANDAANASFYFAKIHPTDYTVQWRVSLRIQVTAPASYMQSVIIQFGGYGSTFSSFDAYTVRNSNLGMYFVNLYRATSAGITTNHKGHALGIGLRSSTNPTTAAQARTIKVELLEAENCTVAFTDAAVKYASIDGTGSTNYTGLTEMSVAAAGQNATNNANTSYQQHGNAVKTGTNGVRSYSLIMKDTDSTWSSLYGSAYNGTGTGKTVCTTGFILDSILYSAGAPSGGNYAAGSNTSTVYDGYPIDFRYSSNCATTLTAYKPVYLVGEIHSDGLFYLDQTWWTQTVPTTEDGKTYVYIGEAYSTYQVWLSVENKAYQFYDGAFITYDEVQNAKAKKVATNFMSADTTGIMVADMRNGSSTPSNPSGRNVMIDNDSVDIRDGQTVLASFGETMQIGKSNRSHLSEDFHSLQLVDKEGYTYLHISDLRDISGYAKITEFFVGDGTTTEFRVNFNIDSDADHDYSVTVDGVELTYETDYTITYYGAFEMVTAPIQGAQITITYYTKDRAVKAYTLGERLSASTIGAYSIAEGKDTTASGYCSHAEGRRTVASGRCSHAEGGDVTSSNRSVASGDYSHAEGYGALASGYNSHAEGMGTVASGQQSHAEGRYTTASGDCSHAEGGKPRSNESGAMASGNYSHVEGYCTIASGSCAHAEGHTTEASGYLSHAQNFGTKASSAYQTVIGRYNIEDTNDKYALIIGKGIADNTRNNALAVDWYGDVEISLNTSASSGTTDGYLYAAITALGWESEVIV